MTEAVKASSDARIGAAEKPAADVMRLRSRGLTQMMMDQGFIPPAP